ncbi:MAG: O-antigen ligase family protein [Gemmatimonadaceae bacterium]|nr:O-antigen ligase family protein [Gemmatimonadaceae bacterium]
MTASSMMLASARPAVSLPGDWRNVARGVRIVAALLAISALFSSAAAWGWNTGRLPAPPLAIMLVIFALTGMAVLLDLSRLGSGAIMGWALASASVAMAAFLWSSGSDVALQEVLTRTLSSLQLIAFVILLADPRVRRIARGAVVIASLAAVAMNLWEITHPMAFSMSLGRSAGFYVNPNITGAALIAGMLLGLPAVPTRLREPYLLLIAVGVFTTLSRGALLCWVMVIAFLIVSRAVRGKRLAITFAVGVTMALSAAGAMLASGQLGYLGGGAEQFVRQRLAIGNKEQLGADVSASSRSHLAMRAVELFGERPVGGHGTGATIEWSEPESTHNIYVRHLAEYGLLGAWLVPVLLVLGWRAAPYQRHTTGDAGNADVRVATARAFVVFVGLWGLFSHNVLDDAFVLFGVALTAALPVAPAGDHQ